MSPFFVYIIKCKDGTLYTGITTDLDRRIAEHNSSKLGAKYTRARRPVKLAYSQKFLTRSAACRQEARIKQFTRVEKLALIKKKRR
ncbi:MAG TPA: GIY-YIG nuclease family protein [Patescibacteria group bacterium]|nr:GIY-YIG nuclease family protein [Patescibacteria group bacterium]